MRRVLDDFPIDGRVVIGSADEESPLYVGGTIGAGGEQADLALDPLEGRGVVARGGNGAMSMIAVGERGLAADLPDMYMRKLAVGPRRARVDRPAQADARERAGDRRRVRPASNDITTIVLDRPRHHDLIEDIRASGARIKLIQDGTVTASISAAIRGTNDHLASDRRHAPGGHVRGGAALPRRRGAGAALADVAPRDRGGARARDRRSGRVFTTEELAPGEVIVAATGVSNGDLLRGVRFPRRLAPHALARDVHALQLGALHGRDPLLRARAARGSAAARLLGPGFRPADAAVNLRAVPPVEPLSPELVLVADALKRRSALANSSSNVRPLSRSRRSSAPRRGGITRRSRDQTARAHARGGSRRRGGGASALRRERPKRRRLGWPAVAVAAVLVVAVLVGVAWARRDSSRPRLVGRLRPLRRAQRDPRHASRSRRRP
jgi:fructose-1,6-bisphosphatase/sedoheptulose 1,7-bisphosphatase-like protein